MKLLFLGAGATGGYFGGRLAAAGVHVEFLVRPARAARLRDQPLRIESPLGNVAVPVKAVIKDALGGADYDLVVLSCKAYGIEDAIASIRSAVGASTYVLPVLNGLAHLDQLDAALGAERILGGLVQIAATLAEDGTVRHLNRNTRAGGAVTVCVPGR
ncbi:MAG TPA: 2-dehydropantoate 2-reductase N-terminal domain-containing protein [Rhodospirillales bacterium]|nr:2-dehydropantoate 2-reductase N-terminal domain-containing protein [Rhodospirillales bacterium]